ncbi:MAG: hypothetical protein ABI321_03990 [Polyangia bacterium]
MRSQLSPQRDDGSAQTPKDSALRAPGHEALQAAGAAATARIAAEPLPTDRDSLDDAVVAHAFLAGLSPPKTSIDPAHERAEAQRFLATLNATLESIGVPQVEPHFYSVGAFAGGNFIAFLGREWKIMFDPALFAGAGIDSVHEALFFHEARHAEQYFRVLRLLAGRKTPRRAMRKVIDCPDSILDRAMTRPIAEHDEGTDEARVWLASLSDKAGNEAKEQAIQKNDVFVRVSIAGETLLDSTSSPEAKAAAAVEFKRVYPTIHAYMAIPFEADAYHVGAAIDAGEDSPAYLARVKKLADQY